MTGPAVIRWRAGDPLRLAIAALAVGELLADKLPVAPPRTIPPALLFRALSGGYCGRAAADGSAGERLYGTLAGVLGAIAASYGGLVVRAAVVRLSRLPDPLVALAEDALAIGAAIRATR
jgi:uncharacterized membrane protein